MRKILLLSLFFFMSIACAKAQGNSGSVPNGQANGFASSGGQNLLAWLQSGGAIPQPVAMAVVREACDWGQQNFGLSLGQMVQKYNQGLLTVTFLSTAPPALLFRVSFGGSVATVLLEDF